jgi:hypothetical protein
LTWSGEPVTSSHPVAQGTTEETVELRSISLGNLIDMLDPGVIITGVECLECCIRASPKFATGCRDGASIPVFGNRNKGTKRNVSQWP